MTTTSRTENIPTPLLSTLSDQCRRQVELTINALCRTTRRAVRQAEALDKLAPTREISAGQRESAWQEVTRRCTTLCHLLAQLKPHHEAEESAPESAPESESEKEVAPASEAAPQHAKVAPALELEAARIAALPRRTIGQVRHAQREENKLMARITAEGRAA